MTSENNNHEKHARELDNLYLKKNSADISNICGGITDEEFAGEFLAYPKSPESDSAKFQFNFLGAQLEKAASAQKIREDMNKK